MTTASDATWKDEVKDGVKDDASSDLSSHDSAAEMLGPSVVDSEESGQSWKGSLWAVSFSIWTVLAVLSVAGSRVYYVVAGGQAPPWKFLLGVSFTDAYVWAILTPFIYQFSRRYSFDVRSWAAAARVHAGSVFFFAVSAAFATSGLNWALRLVRDGVPITFRSETMSLFLQNLPRYCLLVAVTQAILYAERLQARRLQSSRLEAQLVQAQLQALKMQLQPHFLFNVLNSIATLSRKDPPAAEKMTLQVAELLRLSLQSADLHQVPLRREIEFLDCYLRIQQTRFQDRLRVRFDIDPAILDAAVPPLLLQPLVENAVRHGIGPRPEPGHITVRALRRDQWLDLEIVDNGVGLLHSENRTLREGVGLKNTRARLRQLYGQSYKFECENVVGGGCRVSIRLPFIPVSVPVREESR